jgi:NAD(P)-dependent dehydrogenase (short-subunit alcohol dehydrogenase family)
MSMVVRFTADRMMGPLDILVHCAALTGLGEGIREGWAVPFEHQSVEAFRYSLDLGLTAPFVMAQELLHDPPEEQGTVVLLGSIYGLVAPALSLYDGIDGVPVGPAGYSATKAGQLGLVRHLASILAPNFRVNCLIPGGIERGQPPEFVDRYSQRTLLGRMSTEDDLRGAIAFLCSGMSGYMTGQVLTVDGGFTAI